MTREDVIKNILSEYKSHRQLIEDKKSELLDSFFTENQEYRDIVLRKRQLTFKIAGLLADNNAATDLIKEQNDLINKENELLKKYNIGNDLNKSYNCQKCSDTGYVNGVLCSCINSEIHKRLSEVSNLYNLSNYSLNCDLDKVFKDTAQYKEMVSLYNNFKEYAYKFPDVKYKNLLLLGNVGVGKTAIISALCNEIIKKEHSALYLTAFSLHNIFLNYHTAPLNEKASIIEPLINVDFLAIDDLGTEPIFKNITLEYLFMVLDTRMVSEKSFALCSNLDINNLLDRYGERVFSRMTNKRCTLIKRINGDNLRLE